MGTWKNPVRLVWHEVICSRCSRIINRVKLPGLIRSQSHRLCTQCAAGGAGPSRRGGNGGGSGAARPPRERRTRTPRRTQETTSASS